jgi:hypothetical protein
MVLYHMAKTRSNCATNPFKLRNKPVQTAQQTHVNGAQTYVNGAKTD